MALNLNNIWRQFSVTGNETLSLSAYGGAASLTMFRKGTDNRKPAIKFTLSRGMQLAMIDRLKALLDAPPGTRSPIVQLRFSKENRTYENDTQFVFVKDDKKCFSIEISNKFFPAPIKFNIRSPSTYSFGSEPLSDELKSRYGLEELIRFLEFDLPLACLLSRDAETTQSHGRAANNRRSPGTNNYLQKSSYNSNSGNTSGSRDPFDGTVALEEENVFG